MTIPLEVLKRVSVVYTHAHCPDGMASAMILKDAFRMLGASPRIEFLTHGTPEHKVAGFVAAEEENPAWSLFCDIAPHPEARPYTCGRSIVLDHHKGAEELVRSFGEFGVFADEKLEPGVSGAVLAFREVWRPALLHDEPDPSSFSSRKVANRFTAVEDFAFSVGARDTWQTNDPRFQLGQWISKMLMARPKEYWLREGSDPYLTQLQVDIGMELFVQHQEAVRQAVDQCVEAMLEWPARGPDAGVRLLVFQEQASGFRLCSDVAEALRSRYGGPTVVAGFAFVVDKPGAMPWLVYSLRGIDGFDVAAFAKANGGGGHTAAAGFRVDSGQLWGPTPGHSGPYAYIRAVLADFLER